MTSEEQPSSVPAVSEDEPPSPSFVQSSGSRTSLPGADRLGLRTPSNISSPRRALSSSTAPAGDATGRSSMRSHSRLSLLSVKTPLSPGLASQGDATPRLASIKDFKTSTPGERGSRKSVFATRRSMSVGADGGGAALRISSGSLAGILPMGRVSSMPSSDRMAMTSTFSHRSRNARSTLALDFSGGKAKLAASGQEAVISGGESDEEGEAPRCLRCRQLCGKLRLIAPLCRTINRSKGFQILMFVSLLWALLLPDMWIVVNRPNNDDLDIVLTVVLVLFLFELLIQTVGMFTVYLGAAPFWADIVGACSLLLDLKYLPFSDALEDTGGDGGGSGGVWVARAARIGKLGARAGRFMRLVKLLRFLPGLRGDASAVAGAAAKNLSARLLMALASRTAALIIAIVMLIPLFESPVFPVQDYSMNSWLQILDNAAQKHPDRFADYLAMFAKYYGDMEMDYHVFTVQARAGVTLPQTVLDALPYEVPGPVRPSNIQTQKTDSLVCQFDFTVPNQIDALMNMVLVIVIMILMIGFSFVLSNAVSIIVLKPLDGLLLQVRSMAANIFKSVADVAMHMHDTDEESLDEEELGAEDDGCANAFGAESLLLEKVVQKLAVLTDNKPGMSSVLSEQDGSTESGKDVSLIEAWQRVLIGMQEEVENEEYQEMPFSERLRSSLRTMLDDAGLKFDLLDSWSLNPLELDKARIAAVAIFVVGTHNHNMKFDRDCMDKFLERAEAGYLRSCPYHNWFHAVDVAHCMYRLFRLCCADKYLTKAERFALVLSSVCHDLGHPGLNNSFLIETSHELAILYNDKSPLESMHTAQMFELTQSADADIFSELTKAEYNTVRKVCIDAILHTDSAKHFTMIKELQMLYEVNSYLFNDMRHNLEDFPGPNAISCFQEPDTRRKLVRTLIRTADMSNSTKAFRICRIWASQYMQECFAQGDLERKLAMPLQSMNDRDTVQKAASQLGMIEFLVAPLLFSVQKVLAPTSHLADQMVANAKSWSNQWVLESKPSEKEKKANADRLERLDQRLKEAKHCKS
eukprot:TRINITY_DN111183_c0_g1_i1.p1 TRINITY_DN111183_c0_g1~~TRINITY_DN111183_c0_g1_i1.p1  ORF type:complete len:1035 (+),score=223.85 TRINITY_DN111183_c0_g1_i1:105-3209(+)